MSVVLDHLTLWWFRRNQTSLDNLTFSQGDSVFTPYYPSLGDCGKDVTAS